MENKKCRYVFAVCGERFYIEQLHFAIRMLTKRSAVEVVVVTDTRRNELPIIAPRIVDVETPTQFNHHQASIYLKTSLPRHVEPGFLYCYLDSDVVAVSDEADNIFNQFQAPVTFAADVGKLEDFSPFAVNCGCLEQTKALKDAEAAYDSEAVVEYRKLTDLISSQLDEKNRSPIGRSKNWFKYHFGDSEIYRLSDQFYQHKTTGKWFLSNGLDIQEKYERTNWISKVSGCEWDSGRKYFVRKDGSNAQQLKCDHLKQFLQEDFGATVPNGWQHWNGGVFLFDDSASDFFADWHRIVLQVFENLRWKTRDQGALIATVFRHQLQERQLLGHRFNLIVINETAESQHLGRSQFQLNGNTVDAVFIHVIEGWKDPSSTAWDWIEALSAHD